MKDLRFAVSAANEAPPSAPILLVGDICSNLRTAASLGYSAIEIHTRETANLDYYMISKTTEECGTKVAMVITGRLLTEGEVNLIDDSPCVTESAIKGMKKYVEMASTLGADIVIGWVKGNVPAGGNREKYIKRLGDNLRIIANYGSEMNVRVCIEVINHYEVNVFTTCRELFDFLVAFQLSNCYIHLDTFHMNIEESDPVEAIHLAGKRLGYIHLADNTRRYPGSGQLNFSKILNALAEIDYNGYISIECLPYPSGIEAADRAIKHVKALLKGVSWIERDKNQVGFG
jgi:sugar phosphate isomerase/epimerase